jgi:site-specific DNA-methyltransferase (adenine-specific)
VTERPAYWLMQGDCRELMRNAESGTIDSIVTDPPYGLSKEPDIAEVLTHWLAGDDYAHKGGGFMGKSWDSFVPGPVTWKECYRVLKPGGYLVAFAGTRTFDLMSIAIRLAGFEIRDTLCWLYGSGFPKSHNLKGEFDGWGTALKPAYEPIILARKPLIGTVARNVLEYGTGALNIDGCLIKAQDLEQLQNNWNRTQSVAAEEGRNAMRGGLMAIDLSSRKPDGRWPANVILSDSAAAVLDEQSGERKSVRSARGGVSGNKVYGTFAEATGYECGYGDTGGASRFFLTVLDLPIDGEDVTRFRYQPKASRAERNAGLDGVLNHHPTVKPIALMKWLVTLVTPKGGLVLDPFNGSGTTGIAAHTNGFSYVGMDLGNEYIEISERRIAYWSDQTYGPKGETTE